MKFDETITKARHETASGSLERIIFSDEDPAEKSLLTLIEEHRPDRSQKIPATAPETGSSPFADSLDDTDEGDQYRFDHLMMRLGGNGF
jgi:hypothetical protein